MVSFNAMRFLLLLFAMVSNLVAGLENKFDYCGYDFGAKKCTRDCPVGQYLDNGSCTDCGIGHYKPVLKGEKFVRNATTMRMVSNLQPQAQIA